jgi:hypothetical protein
LIPIIKLGLGIDLTEINKKISAKILGSFEVFIIKQKNNFDEIN